MNNFVIREMIRSGSITYKVGDKVILFRRKGNGYPKGISDGEIYIVRRVENESIEVAKHSTDRIGFLQSIKVHKSYMIPIYLYRDIKINSIIG